MLPVLLTKFAEAAGPVVHIAPGGVFHLGGFSITNSILYGWVAAVIIMVTLFTVARKVTVNPKGGFIQLVEVGVEFIRSTVESGFEDKKKAQKYIPYFVTLFFFLVLNNWMGLIPGIGESLTVHGVPLFRAFTGDFNATLAAAVITMGVVYGASIKESGGLLKYLEHFFVGNPLNPMYLLLGIIEMFTDMTRILSLSLRLFLNVSIGEIVIAVFAYLGHFLAPLTAAPFTLIELFVGALQAYIFTILSVMYLAIVVNHVTDKHLEEDLTEDNVPETMNLQTEKA